MRGRRGQLILLDDRHNYKDLVNEAIEAGASKYKACRMIGLSIRTLQRWQAKGEIIADKRLTAKRPELANKLTEQERQSIIAVCNTEEFASLPPSQIVPVLADRGDYIASESSFYRVLKEEGMLHHRGKAKARKVNNKPTGFWFCLTAATNLAEIKRAS